MDIRFIASGTRGDVQPYIALGRGLQQAGHQVSIITSDDFEKLVSQAGLQFRSMGVGVESLIQSEEWKAKLQKGNFLTIVRGMNRLMSQHVDGLVQRLPDLCRGADALIAGVGGMGGAFSIAEKFNIPFIQAYVFPLADTTEFPSPLLPYRLGASFHRLSFFAMRQLLWLTSRAMDVKTRQRLGMSKAPVLSHFGDWQKRGILALYGYSEHVLPMPHDWAKHQHITGYWFLDEAHWTPPQSLSTFLEAGDAPVYIGFGSMNQRNPQAATQMALEALALSGQRGVLASGWGGLSQTDLPEQVYMLQSAPHAWLFPRMAAVVHHGGAGTTAAGLRAGVPSIITPFMGDQLFWGKRVAELGVGTAPIPQKRLNAHKLAQAIRQTVEDANMRRKAAELGARLQSEDGVARSVQLIESYLQHRL